MSVAILALALSVMAAGPGVGSANGKGTDNTPALPAGVVKQNPEEALAADVALLAEESGLSMASIRTALVYREAFDEYALGLFARYPNQIAAAFVEPIPSTAGHIRFVGAIPPGVDGELAERGLDVAELSGSHEISLEQQQLRSKIAAKALVEAGYENVGTHFDVFSGKIHIDIKVPTEDQRPDPIEVQSIVRSGISDHVAGSPADLPGRAAQILSTDLDLSVFIGEGPLAQLAHTRGGNKMLFTETNEDSFCTSGWTVNGSVGDGVTSAGHCVGLNYFKQPGVTPYDMTFRGQVHGEDGDVEWHTTTHIELAEFYATASSIRDTLSFEQTHTMVGDSVCVYGRASNNRTCNHTVLATGKCVSTPTLICNLVETTYQEGQLTLGDSGGGWSWSTRAYGGTSAYANTPNERAWFMPIRETEIELNVTLLTQ